MQLAGFSSAVLHPLIRLLDGPSDELRERALDTLCSVALAIGPDFAIFVPTVKKARAVPAGRAAGEGRRACEQGSGGRRAARHRPHDGLHVTGLTTGCTSQASRRAARHRPHAQLQRRSASLPPRHPPSPTCPRPCTDHGAPPHGPALCLPARVRQAAAPRAAVHVGGRRLGEQVHGWGGGTAGQWTSRSMFVFGGGQQPSAAASARQCSLPRLLCAGTTHPCLLLLPAPPACSAGFLVEEHLACGKPRQSTPDRLHLERTLTLQAGGWGKGGGGGGRGAEQLWVAA